MHFLSGALSPQLQGAGSLCTPVGETFFRPMHNHPDRIEFVIVAKGEAAIQIGGRTYEVHPQSLVIYNQGVWHEEKGHCPLKMYHFGFSNFTLSGLPPGCFVGLDKPSVIPLGDHFTKIESRFQEMEAQRNNRQDDPFGISNYLLLLLLSEILSIVYNKPSRKRSNPNAVQIVTNVKHYMEEHYRAAFSLEQLSRLFFTDKFYLSRIFKREIGVSPIQYLISYRMDVAKFYLESTNDSIEAISESVGYQSVTHFQNVFKKVVGITPGRYRSNREAIHTKDLNV